MQKLLFCQQLAILQIKGTISITSVVEVSSVVHWTTDITLQLQHPIISEVVKPRININNFYFFCKLGSFTSCFSVFVFHIWVRLFPAHVTDALLATVNQGGINRDQAAFCLKLDTDEIECCNFLNDQSLEPSI